MKERFALKAAVYIFIKKGDKLLLLRRYTTGWKDGEYSLVSGHLDPRESVTSCAVREAKEEAGIDINEKDLQFIHVMHRFPHADYIDFFFLVEHWQGEPKNMEPDKCDDMQWFDENNLPKNLIDHVRDAWERHKKGIYFSVDDML